MKIPLSLAAAVFLARSALAAETIGVLAVSDPPAAPPELVEVTAQFRAVLAERTSGVLEAAELRERMAGQTSTASLSELDRAYAGALATYQAGDYEGSIRTLRAVVQDLERLPDSPEAFDQWSRAMLRLARAEQAVGRAGESQAALERLVRANPAVKVEATQYPPTFIKQVEDVRAAVKAMKTRKLTVNAVKGVRVFVDGRDIGPAPAVANLPPGKYRVSGSHQGLRVPGVIADLTKEDQTVELDVRLAEALRPSAGPGLALAEPERTRRIITACAWLGLDRAVTATFAREDEVTFLVGTLYDIRRGSIQREGRLRLAGKVPPAGGLAALATFLMTGQPSTLVAVAPAQPVPPSLKTQPPKPAQQAVAPIGPSGPAAPGQPGKSKALGWAAVGTGVAAIALGAVSIVEARQYANKKSEANRMIFQDGTLVPPYTRQQYTKAVDDANSAKSAMQVTAVGAGVALASTAVLGYLSYKQTGEIGPFRF